jgi:hypothetical protein
MDQPRAEMHTTAAGGQNGCRTARPGDPRRYPRCAPVEDAEALRLIHETNGLWHELGQLERKARIAGYMFAALREELLRRLESLYPEVRGFELSGGTMWLEWQGQWWFVGWDDLGNRDEPDHAQVPGQYL